MSSKLEALTQQVKGLKATLAGKDELEDMTLENINKFLQKDALPSFGDHFVGLGRRRKGGDLGKVGMESC